MNIIDISMEIEQGMIRYPGNPEPKIERYRELPEDSTTESEICMGSHTGTHVDAPEHIDREGKAVNQLNLENFYGRAQVLDLTDCSQNVDRTDLEEIDISEEIVLLKTENSLIGYDEFREDFTYLTLKGVEYLIEEDVKTVGIDYLSLVKFDGGEKADRAHSMANRKMNVVEGLDLTDVDPGSYIFSGLPLKMATDGSPMRAILIDQDKKKNP